MTIKTTIIKKRKTTLIKNRDIKKITEYIAGNEGFNEGEIVFTLVDDNDITIINRDFLGRDKSTNVITFSYINDFDEKISPVLAEIFININAAKREAKEVSISTRERIFQLIIHGILHGFGYEHVRVSKKEAGKMLEKEILYYNKLKIILAYE